MIAFMQVPGALFSVVTNGFLAVGFALCVIAIYLAHKQKMASAWFLLAIAVVICITLEHIS